MRERESVTAALTAVRTRVASLGPQATQLWRRCAPARAAVVRALVRVPGVSLVQRVPSLWNHQFHDARLILEREGHLQYFQISARLQRLAVRSSMSFAAVLLATFTALTGNNVRVAMRTAQLEREQAETLKTLAELDESSAGPVTLASARTVARRVQERQSVLRRLLETSVSALSTENARLWGDLQKSGINETRFEHIQQDLPAGGPYSPPSTDVTANPESGRIIDEVVRNRDLKEVLRALPRRMPIADAEVSSDFGLRRHPILGKVDEHEGLDLYSRSHDDTVRAVAPGSVKLAGYNSSYGNHVVVSHAGGVETLYGHLARIDVREGQVVDLRTELGKVGSTGLSTGKHLHFEVLVGGVPLDPEKVVSAARNVQ